MSKVTLETIGVPIRKEVYIVRSDEIYGLSILTHDQYNSDQDEEWHHYVGCFEYVFGIFEGLGSYLDDKDVDFSHVFFRLDKEEYHLAKPIEILTAIKRSPEVHYRLGGTKQEKWVVEYRDLSIIVEPEDSIFKIPPLEFEV